MKQVIVYGSGCKNCAATVAKLSDYAQAHGIDAEVTKETSMMAIMQAGVMSTPSVAIDGKIVHSGSVPNDEQIKALMA